MLTKDEVQKDVTYDPVTGYFFSTGLKYSNKPPNSRVGVVHKTKGYRYLTIKGKTYREQRVAFLLMTGEWPEKQVDHINQIKDDNRWENLREVTPSENCWNRPIYKTNKSGYTGVCWNKLYSKWQVICRVKGIQTYLGLYDDVHEAGRVAKEFYETNR